MYVTISVGRTARKLLQILDWCRSCGDITNQVRLPLALFAELCETTTADDPFYAFDHDFTGAREELLADFKVPVITKVIKNGSTAELCGFSPQMRRSSIS